MKNFGAMDSRISVLLVILLSLVLGSCMKGSFEFSTPESTYKLWLETAEKGDIAGNMECITEESKTLVDNQARYFDSFIAGMMARTKMIKSYRIVEQKIDGKEAALVLRGPRNDTFVVPFKKEADGWKVDLVTFMGSAG